MRIREELFDETKARDEMIELEEFEWKEQYGRQYSSKMHFLSLINLVYRHLLQGNFTSKKFQK